MRRVIACLCVCVHVCVCVTHVARRTLIVLKGTRLSVTHTRSRCLGTHVVPQEPTCHTHPHTHKSPYVPIHHAWHVHAPLFDATHAISYGGGFACTCVCVCVCLCVCVCMHHSPVHCLLIEGVLYVRMYVLQYRYVVLYCVRYQLIRDLHTHIHTRTRLYALYGQLKHTRARTSTGTHTHTKANIYTHTHTHTHTHVCMLYKAVEHHCVACNSVRGDVNARVRVCVCPHCLLLP